jgi:hypothetical protein
MHTYEEEDTHLAVWQLGAEAVAGEHFGVVVLFENASVPQFSLV